MRAHKEARQSKQQARAAAQLLHARELELNSLRRHMPPPPSAPVHATVARSPRPPSSPASMPPAAPALGVPLPLAPASPAFADHDRGAARLSALDEACVASFGRLCAVTLQNARLLQVARSAQAKRVSE